MYIPHQNPFKKLLNPKSTYTKYRLQFYMNGYRKAVPKKNIRASANTLISTYSILIKSAKITPSHFETKGRVSEKQFPKIINLSLYSCATEWSTVSSTSSTPDLPVRTTKAHPHFMILSLYRILRGRGDYFPR